MSTSAKQWIVFFQLVVIMLCSYGLTNLPGSLQNSIIKEFKIDTGQYGLYFSVCNWAALVDVLNGYLLDRYLGIKWATLIYSMILLFGVILHCIAGFISSFTLLLIGRTIYGFGVNPLVLCTNKHIIYWFSQGKFINLIYSVNESVIWLGSSACYFISVNLLNYIRLYYGPHDALSLTLCIETIVLSTLVVTSSSILAYLYGKMDSDSSSLNEYKEKHKVDETSSKPTWKDHVRLPLLFWTFSLTVFIYFISIQSFLSMSQVFFQETYHLSTNYSSTLSGLITVLGFLLSPPFGYFLDLFGHNLTCLTSAFLLNILSHGLFAFVDCNPCIPVVIMAISLVLSSSLWSQFQYLVEEHQCMIAYGVAQTGFNGSLAIGTLISGYLIDLYGYDGYMKYLFILVVCALPVLLLVWILNYKRGNILNINPKEKMKYLGRGESCPTIKE